MNTFDFNINLNPAQIEQMDDLVRSFEETLGRIRSQPDSRHKSLAITALEESFMWARQAISRNTTTVAVVEKVIVEHHQV